MHLNINPTLIRKLVIQFVLLLIGNIILGALVGAAFIIFLMLQDPIMAAIPAVIALPGLLLQPWYMAMLFLPQGYLVSPIIASVITLGAYYYLNRTAWFQKVRRKLPKLKPLQWVWTAFIIVSVGCGLIFARFKDFPALKTGIPKGSPYTLRSIEPEILGQGRYYQLPSFLDQEALWQVKLNESQLEGVLKPLGLKAIAAEDFPDAFYGMPPYWWRPTHNSATQYFSTKDFPAQHRGGDGHHAIALWNPGDQLFYLWIKDNF